MKKDISIYLGAIFILVGISIIVLFLFQYVFGLTIFNMDLIIDRFIPSIIVGVFFVGIALVSAGRNFSKEFLIKKEPSEDKTTFLLV